MNSSVSLDFHGTPSSDPDFVVMGRIGKYALTSKKDYSVHK